MQRNPFEARLVKDLFLDDPCESLDVFMRDIKEVNSYGWYFNPWYQRTLNWVVGVFHTESKNPWAGIDPHEYHGAERRKNIRTWFDDKMHSMALQLKEMKMPKTEKVEHLDRVA